MEMKARCCIITTVHSPFDVRIFHKQAKSLVKAGFDVVLIAQHNKHEIIGGVEIIPLPRSHNRALRMLRTLSALKLAVKQKANIYHFHDPELIYVGLILKLLGKRVIYDAHEDLQNDILLAKDWIPSFLRKPISIFANIIEQISARIFDGIVAATDLIGKKFPAYKTAIVRNFPPVESFREITRYKKSSLNSAIAVYTGGLMRIRGIRQLVEAFSYLREVELWLVGEFEDQLFQREIEEKVPSNVKILGIKNFEEVIQLYKKADIGVVCYLPMSIHLDAMPNKLFEYMAAGLPVIASNFPLWGEFVNGCGLLVNPEDPKDIADTIKNLLADPKALQRMGEEGQRKFMKRYNWDQEFPRLLELYKRIMEV
jgi:glycosyltransferase involved in cell wall biosynthesis